LLITAISIPLIYLVAVPEFIRQKVRDLDLSLARVARMHVSGFNAEAVNTSMHVTMPPQFPLPIQASILPFTLTAFIQDSKGDLHHLAEMHFPLVLITLNEDVVLDVELQASWAKLDQQFIQDFCKVGFPFIFFTPRHSRRRRE
jgi:hypothetical protein